MKTADAITHIGRCDCGSKNFKRVYKKTFPATFDYNGQDLPAPDKLEWRAFECKDCESTFFDVGERAAWLHELTECTHALDIKLFKFGG